jgi:hypothetical protein
MLLGDVNRITACFCNRRNMPEIFGKWEDRVTEYMERFGQSL